MLPDISQIPFETYEPKTTKWTEYKYDGATCECCGHEVSVNDRYCGECKEALMDE